MCNCSFKVILIKSCGDLFLWNRNWGFGRVEFRLHIFFLFHGVHTLSFTLLHHRGGICRSPGAGGPLCLGWLPGFMGIWCKRLNTITTIWSTPFILPQAIEASDIWMVRRCCLTDKPLVAGRYHLTLLGLRPLPFPRLIEKTCVISGDKNKKIKRIGEKEGKTSIISLVCPFYTYSMA